MQAFVAMPEGKYSFKDLLVFGNFTKIELKEIECDSLD